MIPVELIRIGNPVHYQYDIYQCKVIVGRDEHLFSSIDFLHEAAEDSPAALTAYANLKQRVTDSIRRININFQLVFK